jgi:AraC-like DNA-binding protein
MLHSIPAVAPSAPCFTLGRAAHGRLAVGYAAFGSGSGRPVAHRLLPLTFPVLILDFDSGRALLTGPRTRSSVDGSLTWTRGISVGLTPSGAARLAGMPLSEISGQTRFLYADWPSRLAAQPSWEARFAWLDNVFATDPTHDSVALGDSRWCPSAAVLAAWWHLQRAPRVSAVADALGLTRRRLERDFHREIGLSPGEVARTARLQRSLVGLARGEPPAVAAATGGYADQSHLTRTMRDLVGLTPAAFRAFLQDVAPGAPLTSRA